MQPAGSMLCAGMEDERFQAATAAFDAANAEDPNTEMDGSAPRPRELVDAERLSGWIDRILPDAPEALRLAARCQHLERWRIPRSDYPEGRAGYLRWRTALSRFHADQAERILRRVGYDDETIAEVRRINVKQGLRSDPLVQAMEDALCLSFLQHELEAFAGKHEPDKVVSILQKTWKKMSPRARELAGGLALAPTVAALVERALRRTS